jgi:hypothetical protein
VTAIRAIPRTYAGVRFRSTLEADWAYNLDLLSISWQYEPEGVQLPSGECYRPDFYLPEISTWLEVKGPHDERVDKIVEFGRAVWGDSRSKPYPHPPDQVVLVGRPAERGVMTLTDPSGCGHSSERYTRIQAARCHFCQVVQFYLPWRLWGCRKCDCVRWSDGESMECSYEVFDPFEHPWRQLSWK